MEAEEKVRSFYEGKGWDENTEGTTTDAALFEDLRPCAENYVKACRNKLLSYLPKKGEFFLDAASGPIQYPEYLEYSKGFKKRVCVDFSEKALIAAKNKLGDRGEYIKASLLELPFSDDYFDAVVSLHTIYHIDSSEQEKAVRQLLRVAKPGVPIVIVYSNPERLLARIKRVFSKNRANEEKSELYFYCHPLNWWDRFKNQASVNIYSWRSLTAKDAQRLIPNNALGKTVLKLLLRGENLFPKAMAHLGAYPVIVLKKI